jgi:hypothetical protein
MSVEDGDARPPRPHQCFNATLHRRTPGKPCQADEAITAFVMPRGRRAEAFHFGKGKK